jgi:CRISPR/Cas system endoribonuclease Cas6 (RAMP superfamily)
MCILILSGCKNNTKNEPVKIVSKEEAIEFVDAYIQKIINKEYDSAYEDYMDEYKLLADKEEFKNIFEKTLKETFGELKGAEFEFIFYGEAAISSGTINVADLFYKALIDEPDTYVRATITKVSDEIKVVFFGYVKMKKGHGVLPGKNIKDDI